MKIEVLHIDNCPNWQEAAHRVRAALTVTGHPDAEIELRLLRTTEDAAGVAFAGSPTITIDGDDLFPSGGHTADLACRIYFTPTGFAGVPTTEQLAAAIRAHGD